MTESHLSQLGADSQTNNTQKPDMRNAHQPPQKFKGFIVNNQYLKSLKFESPQTPAVFLELSQDRPDAKVEVLVQTTDLGGSVYEVVISLLAKTRFQDKTLFEFHLDYAAVTTIADDLPEKAKEGVLLVEVPRLLFPFLRRYAADITQEAGFPPLVVNPVDFLTLLRRRMEQKTTAAS